MNNNETARIIAEAALKLEEAKDRIHYLNEALLTAHERITELEKLCEQQRTIIKQSKETIRQGKYKRLSEYRRSM